MNPQHAAETRLHEALTTATLDGTLTVNAADLAALCREVATTRRDLERLREVDRGIGTEQVLALAAAHDQLITEHEQATEAIHTVRSLHAQRCQSCDIDTWPCPTRRVLDNANVDASTSGRSETL